LNLKKAVRVGLANNDKSQEDLAEYLNKSPVTVSNYMTGKTDPPFKVVCAMAEYFNLKLSDFCANGE
jgi:transcriptional regulator with XRE-family HTH domain